MGGWGVTSECPVQQQSVLEGPGILKAVGLGSLALSQIEGTVADWAACA